MKTQFMAMALMAALLSSANSFATAYPSPLKVNVDLLGGDVVTSPNGKYMLTLQSSDGNLVVYRNEGMKPLWASHAYGGTAAVVQADGNFVVYATHFTPPLALWSSNTGARPVSSDVLLWLRDDGSLALTYNGGQVWATPPDPSCPTGEPRRGYTVCVTTPDTEYTRVVQACSLAEAIAIAGRAHDAVDVRGQRCRPERIPK